MNASLPKITIPKLTPDEKEGLQHYWSVYEAHREEITAQVMEMACQHPESKIILQNASAQPTPEEQARSREIQRRAVIENDWEPYLKNLQLPRHWRWPGHCPENYRHPWRAHMGGKRRDREGKPICHEAASRLRRSNLR